jgi:hypothetical protein
MCNVGSKTTCGFASLGFPATSGTPAGDCPGVRGGGDLRRGVTGVDLPCRPGCRPSRAPRGPGPPPLPVGIPVVCAHKTLPLPPSLRYNPLRRLPHDRMADRPAVQFNPFYPAGPAPRSWACSPPGPPDKSLFVRLISQAEVTFSVIYEWDPAKAEANLRKHGVSF